VLANLTLLTSVRADAAHIHGIGELWRNLLALAPPVNECNRDFSTTIQRTYDGSDFPMLIHEKLPPGHIYPQITQTPTTYADFLDAFRGGHTIDDNLGATTIAATLQARMLEIAIASGHLKKTRGTASPNESLADIFLTKSGSELIQTFFDRKFCDVATAEARKSIAEDDGELHPYVGAVVVKDGKILTTGYRGETGEGRHAEYCALRKINDDVDNVDLSGCTVYTTLEPCSERKPGKTPCTNRLINGKVARVVYGLADKDETVYGHSTLVEAGIEIGFFSHELMQELHALNKKWNDSRRAKQGVPPPNDTPPLASVSYYKLGTSMADNTHFFVRPPKDAGGFFTVEDAAKTVLAHARTLDEIAIAWHGMDDRKRIVEKLVRQSAGSSSQLLNLV
jgi:pyrimidine deaminase RibD-like protein